MDDNLKKTPANYEKSEKGLLKTAKLLYIPTQSITYAVMNENGVAATARTRQDVQKVMEGFSYEEIIEFCRRDGGEYLSQDFEVSEVIPWNPTELK